MRPESDYELMIVIFFFNFSESEEGLQEGEAQIQMGRMFPLLQVRLQNECHNVGSYFARLSF